MRRWTLIGIHVAFAIALQSRTVCGAVSAARSPGGLIMNCGAVSAARSPGGLIMKVSQLLAMNITMVPQTFSATPRPRWTFLERPFFQRSHP
jgi:hypothetical protein